MSSASVAAVVLTAAHLLLPGLLLSLAAGARLVTAVTTAPVVSFGLVTLIGRITTATGIPWEPLTFTLAVVVLAVAVVLVRRWLRTAAVAERLPWRTPDAPPVPMRQQVLTLVAAGAAAVLGMGTALWGIGTLTATNQGFDALFHVNAITLISETHDADPAAVMAINHFPVGSEYYPNGMHALAALVADLGVNPVVAANAMVAAVPAVLALGLAGLLWQLGMLRHALVAPFIGISIATFPTDVMWRGPIWPFALGLALIPAVVALIVGAIEQRSRALAGLAVLGAAGLLLVHPSAALAAAVFAAAYFVQRWVTRQGRLLTDIVPLLVISVLVVVVALPAVITALSNSGAGADYDWPAVQRPAEAVGEFLLFGYDADYPQLWLFALFVIGLLTIHRMSRLAWWAAVGGVFGVLLVLAAAYEGRVVALLTGPWWNDRFRFSAMAALGLGVVAAHGVVVVGGWLAALVERIVSAVRRRRGGGATVAADGPDATDALLVPDAADAPIAIGTSGATAATAGGPGRRATLIRLGGLVAALAVFGMLSNGFYSDYNHSRMQKQFAPGTGGSVTAPELEGMAEMASLAGPDETVMNDPRDGSAWMWAIHGVRPMFGAAVLTPIRPALEPDQAAVYSRFNCLDSSAEIRRIVDEYNIHYVYVGDGFIIPTQQRAPGFLGLDEVQSLTKVFDNGGAQIYRIEEKPLVDEADDPACEQEPDSSDE